jgi:predicted NBD/HSP70 family sugar kinase
VLDGALYHVTDGAAGEGGHMSIDYRGPQCGCGWLHRTGVRAAIGRRAQEKLAAAGK